MWLSEHSLLPFSRSNLYYISTANPHILSTITATSEPCYGVIGIDLLEVAPDHDRTGSTARLAAQVLLNLLGFILEAKGGG